MIFSSKKKGGVPVFRKLINTTDDPTIFFTQGMHIPAPLAFLTIRADFLGSIGLILGFLGRAAVFGIACNMMVAVAMVHWHYGFFANWLGNQKGEGFEYHILALAIALAIMIRGSGAFSFDRALSN
ncbi:MAG: hypothetical protein DMG51_19805 [Acidobacteria bacterium]|nr:MAG: hypothetical protein DMG51_19805 [Acidobacteriota bacterium]